MIRLFLLRIFAGACIEKKEKRKLMGKQPRQRGVNCDITNQLFGGARDLSLDNKEKFVDDSDDCTTSSSPGATSTVARPVYAAPVGVLQRAVSRSGGEAVRGPQLSYSSERDDVYRIARANILQTHEDDASRQPPQSSPSGATTAAPKKTSAATPQPKRTVLLKKDFGSASDRDEFRR